MKFIYGRNNIYLSLLSFFSICLITGTVYFFGTTNLLLILIPVILYTLSLYFTAVTYKIFNIQILIDSLVYILFPTLIIFSTSQEFSYSVYILWMLSFVVMSLVCTYELWVVKNYVQEKEFYLSITTGTIIGSILSLTLIYFRTPTIILPMFSVVMYLNSLSWYKHEKKVNNKLDNIKLFSYYIILILLKIGCILPIVNTYHFWLHMTYIIYTIWLTLSFRNHAYKQSIVVLCLLIIGILTPHNQSNTYLAVEAIAFISAIALLFFIKTPVIYSIKTEYANLKILDNHRNNTRLLFSNLILQGFQSLDDDKKNEPTAYFCNEGPIGQLFRTFNDKLKNVAIIGLGTGTASTYGQPGQTFTFYEIDPVMKDIAYNYFSYLRNSKAHIEIILGDARKTLGNVKDHSYDIIICDAYIGVDTPQNLITYEAIRLYISKLTETGILCFHISGRNKTFIDLISKSLKEAGLCGFIQSYDLNNFYKTDVYCEVNGLIGMKAKIASYNNSALGKIRNKLYLYVEKIIDHIGMVNERANACKSSKWICAAREPKDLSKFILNSKWKPLDYKDNIQLITDQTIGYTSF
ncbi:MAG: spermidine synthase [Rickettsiales endosymbiont of Dermacentor nuttalli]